MALALAAWPASCKDCPAWLAASRIWGSALLTAALRFWSATLPPPAEGAVDRGQRQQGHAADRRDEGQGHEDRVAPAAGALVLAAALIGLAKSA